MRPKPNKKQAGYIMILNTLLFIAIMMVIIVAVTNALVSRYSATRGLSYSDQAYLTADSAIQEGWYRYRNGLNMTSPLTVTLGSTTATITVTSPSAGRETINVASNAFSFQHNIKMDIQLGTGISFNYGIQTGQGGFVMQNSSSVTGNVFSGGTITGAGGNMIYGDVVSAGASGLISGIHATGTAYAHTIQSSTIDKDAYYTSISGTTVGGTSHPGSPDQPIAPLPISDAQIAQWESDAQAGGTATCSGGSYNINAATSIGPIKIPCDLNINGTSGGFTVTVGGPIWVVGNITISQKATIAMDPSLGSQNAAIIADNAAASTTSGIINLGNTSTFLGSGSSGSFVFMISQNSCAQTNPSCATDAISIGQSSSALIGYAIHGQLTLSQSVSLKEVTAYKTILKNSANVTYDRGLPSTLFESGPGGTYDMIDWLEY